MYLAHYNTYNLRAWVAGGLVLRTMVYFKPWKEEIKPFGWFTKALITYQWVNLKWINWGLYSVEVWTPDLTYQLSHSEGRITWPSAYRYGILI